MQIETLKSLFKSYKESTLFGRYIHTAHIESLLSKYRTKFKVDAIGKSVLGESIYAITLGTGPLKVLMWSQMHGNESTTTKALFDLLHALDSEDATIVSLLNTCTLKIIPILNPDGAKAYTRLNANGIDLNRDAQDMTQPESIVLHEVFNNFRPDFCFNLHGQRTIFSAGNENKSATLSFLAPAQDADCTLTSNRKIAMSIISEINEHLQAIIPGCIGIYDDAFNLNCVGDTFQSHNVPTILFEAGHYPDDYEREFTRELIFISYILALNFIANSNHRKPVFKPYFKIPQNQKLFYDLVLRNVHVSAAENEQLVDVAIQFQEELLEDRLVFKPKIERICKLEGYFGHTELDAQGKLIQTEDFKTIYEGYYNDFVMLNNEKLSLKSVNH